MDEMLLSKITSVHNDINIGTRKSFSGRDRIMYFVEISVPKTREIDRYFVTKEEYTKIIDICKNTMKEKVKYKAKEKKHRQKLALQKAEKRLKEKSEPVELDDLTIEE